jgi:hypothetical protein
MSTIVKEELQTITVTLKVRELQLYEYQHQQEPETNIADVLRKCLTEGIPKELPPLPPHDDTVPHAPKRPFFPTEAEFKVDLKMFN